MIVADENILYDRVNANTRANRNLQIDGKFELSAIVFVRFIRLIFLAIIQMSQFLKKMPAPGGGAFMGTGNAIIIQRCAFRARCVRMGCERIALQR